MAFSSLPPPVPPGAVWQSPGPSGGVGIAHPSGIGIATAQGLKFAEERQYMPTNEDLIRMIASRLRLHRSDLMGISVPFDHIFCAQLENKVAVFVAKGDQFTVLEDSTEMFPSDTLMTQLRLLKKE